MAKPEERNDRPGHMPEVSALLQAGQMPKSLSPASLPDIDVTLAIEAARMIADVAAVPRPKVAEYPAAGRSKSEMPPNSE
jgi:hypothetical protein